MNLISSFEKSVPRRVGSERSIRWLRPRSRISTDQPAAVSTSATVDPPGPDPTMMASKSRAAMLMILSSPDRPRAPYHLRPARSRLGDLGVGEAPRLHVALETD